MCDSRFLLCVFGEGGVEVFKACHWPVQEMVQVTLSLIGPLPAGFPRWHAASSRGYQEWPLWLLLEISCCLHGISLYRLIHGFYGGPLVADLHILAIQNAFYPQNGCLRIPASHVSLHFTPRSHTIIQKRYYNNDQSRQISSPVRTFLTTYHANYRLYWHSYRLLLIIPGTH